MPKIINKNEQLVLDYKQNISLLDEAVKLLKAHKDSFHQNDTKLCRICFSLRRTMLKGA